MLQQGESAEVRGAHDLGAGGGTEDQPLPEACTCGDRCADGRNLETGGDGMETGDQDGSVNGRKSAQGCEGQLFERHAAGTGDASPANAQQGRPSRTAHAQRGAQAPADGGRRMACPVTGPRGARGVERGLGGVHLGMDGKTRDHDTWRAGYDAGVRWGCGPARSAHRR